MPSNLLTRREIVLTGLSLFVPNSIFPRQFHSHSRIYYCVSHKLVVNRTLIVNARSDIANRITIFIILLSVSLCSHAQDLPKRWLHSGVSMVAYKGDLNGYAKYTSSFHAGIQLNKKRNLNGNINLGFGKLNGEDRNFTFESEQTPPPSPNRFVKTTFFYVNYDLHYNLIKRKNIVVYIGQGVGLMHFNPEDATGRSLLKQPDTRENEEAYRREAILFPTTLGAIFLLPNQYGFSVQTGYYNTLTDYLDNISNLGDTKNDNILAVRFAFFVPLD